MSLTRLLHNCDPWTYSDGVLIATQLTAEMSTFLHAPLNIVHRLLADVDDGDRMSILQNNVVFRVRSVGLSELMPFGFGGIVTVSRRNRLAVTAIVFFFAFGRRMSPSGATTNMELEYPLKNSPSVSWQLTGWLLDEFDEYERYSCKYFSELEDFVPQSTN